MASSGLVYFLFLNRFGHARFRHFFLDASERRFAGFLLDFLLHRTSMMTSRPKQYSSIYNGATHPRQTPPYPGGASHLCVPAKVKAQADAVEIDRTRPAGITLSL